MVQRRPIASFEELHRQADTALDSLPASEWRQAFDCHPKIGDLDSLRMKFSGNKDWSAGEQSGISSADEETIVRLARGNAEYLEKFGFIFIVCATGKSARELLEILERRLPLDPAVEFLNAAEEQRQDHAPSTG